MAAAAAGATTIIRGTASASSPSSSLRHFASITAAACSTPRHRPIRASYTSLHPSSPYSSYHTSQGHCNYSVVVSSRQTTARPKSSPGPRTSQTSRRPYSNSNNNKMADKQPQPTGCIAKEGIELFTMQTPNGFKASIVLEELKEAYGDRAPKVTYQAIDISTNTQKQKWYTDICPNGRIPALVDHDRGGFPVFEGLAILSYLTKHYDPDNRISFPYESDDHSVAEQWMSWQHGGLGPMQGQANHFLRFAKEKIPYGVQRYVGESERLYGILDARLKDRDFLAGPGRGRFSIADISSLGWANMAEYSGVDLPGMFPNVVAWIDRCLARPGVQRGISIPVPWVFTNAAVAQKIKEDPEFRQKAEETKKFLEDSKKQYGYKYASP